jgi:hypothetical protein
MEEKAEPVQAAPAEAEPVQRKRATSQSVKQMARDERRRRLLGEFDPEEAELRAEVEATRPKTRADCCNGPRPCLFVSCKFNLYLDISPKTGSVKLNFPDKEIWELEETCALDVAEEHPEGVVLERVGELMNLTRERIRQVESRAVDKVRSAVDDPLNFERFKELKGGSGHD